MIWFANLSPKGHLGPGPVYFNGKNDNLTRKDFDTLADYFKIPLKVRYEKFIGKIESMKNLIKTSKLSGELKNKFADIVSSRYSRLGIQE